MKESTARFSDRVDDYVKYRPGYPKEFIDFLYAKTGFSEDSVIADIGSGTGILTALLLEKGGAVIGVEPNGEMRKAAETLLKEFPKFVSTDGSAENTKLADHSIDFILCAQAFHWFDQDACQKEFQRILKPGGRSYWSGITASFGNADFQPVMRTCSGRMQMTTKRLIISSSRRTIFGRFSRMGPTVRLLSPMNRFSITKV